MKDQIIHTIVISAAILGAGFVIGTIIKDKPQQVVAEVKPEVKSTDIVINDQLKELIIANGNQQIELANKDKEIKELRSRFHLAKSHLSDRERFISKLHDAGRKNENLLTVYTKIVQQMRVLRNMAGKDYTIRHRYLEIEAENNKLLKEGEARAERKRTTHGPIAKRTRPMSVEEKIKAMSPESRIKYIENKMLLGSILFSIESHSLEKAFKPLVPQLKGLIPPTPKTNSDGTLVMPKNSIEDMLERAIPPASNKPVHIDPLTGQPIPLKPSVVMPQAGSGILTPEK